VFSGYEKLTKALEGQTKIIYTKDEKVVDRALKSAYFSDLKEIGTSYELESQKPRFRVRSCRCSNFITTSWTGISTEGISS